MFAQEKIKSIDHLISLYSTVLPATITYSPKMLPQNVSSNPKPPAEAFVSFEPFQISLLTAQP